MIKHLMKLPAWLIWRTEPHPKGPDRKPLKVPLHWDGVTRHSQWNPAPLLTYDQAVACASVTGCMLGFRPQPEHKVVCLDLDDCLDAAGQPNATAQQWLAYLPGAAVEVSWSGRGLHLWFSHTLPDPGRHGKRNGIELYGSNQFIAMGRFWHGDAAVDLSPQLQQILDAYFPQEVAPTANPDRVDWDTKSPAEQMEALADIQAALLHHDPDSREEWVACGQALVGLGEAGYHLWADWSARSTKWPGGEGLHQWDTFDGSRTGYQAILKRAAARGWVNPRKGVQVKAEDVFKPVAQETLPSIATDHQVSLTSGEGLKSRVSDLALFLRANSNVLQIKKDGFKDRVVMVNGDRTPRFVEEEDYIHLAELLERGGFPSIDHNLLKRTCKMLARENRFDSAMEWASGLVWDGVPRVTTCMSRYFGCEDTHYSRAVGQYLFTAFAGRCLEPGCQADMAIVLVGRQGLHKSSAVRLLVPPDAYIYAGFTDGDKELAMRVKGRLLVEIPEMKGMGQRDIAHIRDWVTRRHEQWRGMHADDISEYARRFVIIGTANGREQLTDPEGNRRWLPIDAGVSDTAALVRDRDQLWAEGVAMWREGGIRWAEAERIALAEVHEEFEAEDAWESRVREWLARKPVHVDGRSAPDGITNADLKLSTADILQFAIGMLPDRVKTAEQTRIGYIMKRLNYKKIRPKINGERIWLYVKNS